MSDLNGNTAIGENALIDAINTSSRDNSAFGFNALTNLNPGTNENTAVGAQALRANQVGENTAVGAYASYRVVGTHNTSVGNWALRYNAGGDENTAVGHRALAGTLTETDPVSTPFGHQNTAMGSGSLRGNNGGNDNTAVGYNVLYNNFDANRNTGIGSRALGANTSGSRNVAMGVDTLTNNTTGTRNAGVGNRSLESMTTGSRNVAMGHRALSLATTGSLNVGIGLQSGDSLTSESNNTLIGANTNISPGVNFGTAIGAGAIVSADNSVVLGKSGDKVGIGISSPVASLHIGGGVCNKVVQFGGLTYNATADDYIILVNGVAGTSVVLPSTAGLAEGHTFIIKNFFSFNPIDVTTYSGVDLFWDTSGFVGIYPMAVETTRTFVHSFGTYYVIAH